VRAQPIIRLQKRSREHGIAFENRLAFAIYLPYASNLPGDSQRRFRGFLGPDHGWRELEEGQKEKAAGRKAGYAAKCPRIRHVL
jgi:hypothetical protein